MKDNINKSDKNVGNSRALPQNPGIITRESGCKKCGENRFSVRYLAYKEELNIRCAVCGFGFNEPTKDGAKPSVDDVWK